MKRFENIFRNLGLVATLACGPLAAAAQEDPQAAMDSVEVGVITCSPHNEVYSLYGHSALHWHDLRTQQHWVFNYGVFDYTKPHFVWRFMMGQTDYMLDCIPSLEAFCRYYRKWGSSVEEQILDLTPSEKLRLQQALAKNLENPVYRYNFFYDNCSTRPRNMVEQCLEGTISYAPRPGYEPTFRQMIHQQTTDHPWAAFGNDLLLGLAADRKATLREQEFLPANLMHDLDHAMVTREGGARPLVLRRVVLVPLGEQTVEKEFPLSPRACTIILFIIALAIALAEHCLRRVLVWWDALLMAATGLAGCILLVMFFSEHPATSSNLQILLLNPLALLFIPQVVRRRHTRWFSISLACLAAFAVGALWQHYAEGMEFVALSLLSRYWIHRHDK